MKKVSVLVVGMFALGLDAYIMAGLLTPIRLTFNSTIEQVGQAVTLFTISYALSAPLFSTFLAGKSTKKILIIALGIFIAGNIISALSPSLLILLLSRIIAGIGAGLYSPMAAITATRLVGNDKRGRALGMILGGMSAGTVVGVPFGLMISKYLGWSMTFVVISCLGVIAVVSILFAMPELITTEQPSLNQRIKMLKNSKILKTIFISFLTAVASLGLYTYIVPILHSNPNIISITSYLWIWGVGGLIGAFSIGHIIDLLRQPKKIMLLILFVLMISLFAVNFFMKLSLLIYVPFFLWGAMGWASQAPQQHTLIEIDKHYSSITVALNSSANYLGGSVGAALGGLLIWYGVSVRYLPYIAGCVILLAILLQFQVVFLKSGRGIDKDE